MILKRSIDRITNFARLNRSALKIRNKKMQELIIDREAKTVVKLKRMFDSKGNPYYIGKKQLCGTLDFNKGGSFMVFVSEEGVEELQIAPMHPAKVKYYHGNVRLMNGRIEIPLKALDDQNGNTYYVGEVVGPIVKDLIVGVFFTVFLSREGYEVLQISTLQHKEDLPEYKVGD
jgi:hypothetical protein